MICALAPFAVSANLKGDISILKLTLRYSYNLICSLDTRETFQLMVNVMEKASFDQTGWRKIWLYCNHVKLDDLHCVVCKLRQVHCFVVTVLYQNFLQKTPGFPSKPQLLLLTLIICYFAPSQSLTPQARPYYLSLPSLLSCAVLLESSDAPSHKPEGLSRSTQITSLWLPVHLFPILHN